MTNQLFLKAAAAINQGRVHAFNQDCVAAITGKSSSSGLFIVADGMGGHQAGDVASRLAVEAIRQELDWLVLQDEGPSTQPGLTELASSAKDGRLAERLQQRLQRAIEQANAALTHYALENVEAAGNMGTTVTCALIVNGEAAIANVGDSRTYLLRQGTLTQITRDHSYVARLVEEGQLEPEKIFTHPRRNVITRSLGPRPDLEVDTFWESLQAGDRLLLCSDGLWEMVQDPVEIVTLIQDADTPDTAVEGLVAAANEYGGADNIGVVVVFVETAS